MHAHRQTETGLQPTQTARQANTAKYGTKGNMLLAVSLQQRTQVACNFKATMVSALLQALHTRGAIVTNGDRISNILATTQPLCRQHQTSLVDQGLS